MIKANILHITGILLTITGIFDAVKYHWSATAIRKTKTARGQSRKFINAALFNDLVRLVHCTLLPDWYLVLSSALALIFMCEHWYIVYLYYPYKYYPRERKIELKRPNILRYLWNSFLPNRIRKHL
jgi:hypothetical protein